MQPTDLESPTVPGQPIDLSTPPPTGTRVSVRALLRRPDVSRGLTVLAGVLVFAALIFPNVMSRLTPLGFVRIPVEGAFIVAALLVLPGRARRVAGMVLGVLLGLLVLEKCLDMGFFEELNRPFDPVLDWVLFDDAYSFAVDSYGRVAAVAAVVAIVALIVAVLALSVWSVLRIGTVIGRNRRPAAFTAGGLAVAWTLTLVLGVHLVGAVPVAARSTVTYAIDRTRQARAGLADEAAFAEEVQVDAFKNTPAGQMLTGLRGKDVLFTFVESYGRSAVESPALAQGVGRVLANGTATLAEAGFAARSGWLTSPTFGGGSWLAHSTFESGLWINNEQRYRNLVSSDRKTLTSAFKGGDWRTVSVMPGATRAWPEGNFYGYDTVWDSRNLGYNGPKFSWAPMPDQYTLKQFNTIEYQKPGRGPLMAEIPLVSSHTPWAPIPRYLPDWGQVGDGSIYTDTVKDAKKPTALWQNPRKVQQEYGKSIQYSLTALINWVKLYGDENLVLVFLGDHQPAPIASGADASHDVPITVVAKDPAVLARIDAWGWQDGLRPAPTSPVWPMSDFRDKFFTAFGSTPATQTH
ncbi:sulfatase [Micromonosporaceae bacterium Da 78-11]